MGIDEIRSFAFVILRTSFVGLAFDKVFRARALHENSGKVTVIWVRKYSGSVSYTWTRVFIRLLK